ncbi:MAG: hypothetical protein V4653_07455 [Pseudomonadota bacterium]
MSQPITPPGLGANPLRTVTRPPAPAVEGLPATPAAVTAAPNPTLRLDSGLGMVVIEFRGASGEVVASLPTPREIAAYRTAALTNAPDASDQAEYDGPVHQI